MSQNFCQSSFPPLKNNSDSSSTTPSSKANLFASIFASNSNLDNQGVQPHHFPPSKFTMSPIKFSTRKVRQTLLQLDTSKSKGPDGIPAIVLKTCAPELALILNKLFQLSYSLGTFPTSWKQAHVFPIPKKGDKSNPLNYRPIAITSLIKLGKDNLVSFNQSKTKQAVISRKRNQNFPAVLTNGDELDTSASFTQLGLSLSSNLTWKTHIHSLAKHASQKLGFLARARGFFSSSHLLSIYKSQIRPSLKYCSHVWGGAPKSTLCLLDKVQSKAIRLINNPNLTKSLQPLSHRRLVGDLSIYYRYFNGHCSQEIRDIIPVPLRRFRTTRSSTHSHPFQVSLPNPRTLSHK